jgi:tetratricopeptide (TPR) repeat protein
VFNNLAVIETKRSQFAKALDYLTVALAADSENPDLWFNAGYALWSKGDYEPAIARLLEVINRRSDDGEAHYLLSKCYAQLGRPQVAKVALEEARKYLPKVAEWERAGQVPLLARLVKKMSWPALLKSRGRQSGNESQKALPTQSRSVLHAVLISPS